MPLSDERIQEMKDLLEKKEGREFSWQEATEAANNLAGLADILFELWKTDTQRKKQLEESPKGFPLEGGYTCFICGNGISNGIPLKTGWYDKWGIKCMICQTAVDRKEIPGSLAKDKESWYSKYDLESRFNLKTPAIRKWVKEGILKSRTVKNENNRTHVELFLIKDNKDFLPPKNLTESHMVRIDKEDGSTWHRIEPWYKFVDPHKHLEGYKIMDHLRVVELDKE